MKASIITAFFVPLLSLGVAVGQNGVRMTPPPNPSAPNGVANTPGGSTTGNAMVASEDLRILSPKLGEKIGTSDVIVRYELTNTHADASGFPTFRVQLDGRDPVETTDTSQNFSGVAPGAHTVTIELVDANYTPITGSQATVHFKTFLPGVKKSKAAPGTTTAPSGPKQPQASLQPYPVVNASMRDKNLPSASSGLPLLSMVGFGVLVGGVISGMRSRRQ
jgi:hypothetical protein